MASLVGSFLLSALVCLSTAKPAERPQSRVDLLMPGVQPQIPDTYLCYPTKVKEDSVYINGFEPVANSSTAHHMLLYGCEEPGDSEKVWNCGEMAAENPKYAVGPVCKEGSQILYAWAMDAPNLKLPKDVAFKVGDDTKVKWLVLQVHYKDVSHFIPPANERDRSGIILETTSKPQARRAGVYLLGTGGEIPGHSTVYLETACSMEAPLTIHPFAYRVHAHTHGEVVSGYRIRGEEWEEIGRMSPKKPQMFYNVTHPGMTVQPGDIVAARCTMVNDENRTIDIGSTQNDEMCNFYMMYWVDGEQILPEEYCFTDGPPHWYWNNMEEIHMENVPGNASVIPGTDQVLQATEQFVEDAESEIEMDKEELEKELLQWLAQYDQEAFDNYMYNLLFGVGENDYPELSQEDYYNALEQQYYPQPQRVIADRMDVRVPYDLRERMNVDLPYDPRDLEDLYPLDEEQLRRYYQKQMGAV